MARGLSDNQKKILKIVYETYGGDIRQVYLAIKAELYPELWIKKEYIKLAPLPWKEELLTNLYTGIKIYPKSPYTFKQGIGYGKIINDKFQKDYKGYYQYKNKMNQARVTISKAVKGLVKRGLIEKKEDIRKEYYMEHFVSEKKKTSLYITQEGKDIVTSLT